MFVIEGTSSAQLGGRVLTDLNGPAYFGWLHLSDNHSAIPAVLFWDSVSCIQGRAPDFA